MSDSGKKKRSQATLIDPIYEKFTRSVIRAIGSTEFYELFMDTISGADNRFQFSNRKLEKVLDLKWVEAIEAALDGFESIIYSPRQVIKEDELIVNVAHAKKAGADVVRHLAQHAGLVEDFDEESGDVRPSKLMQKYREDSEELYENRVVYTVLESAYHFVKIRHEALLEAMGEEFGAKLKVESNMLNAREQVHMEMFLHIKERDSVLDTDDKHGDALSRISRLYRILDNFMHSEFAEKFSKLNRVKGAILPTNVLKKNPNYRKIVKLNDFLREYEKAGYFINITEQNPQIDERFQRDIYHSILFQYIMLKGYLEDEKDREISQPLKERKRKLKPKIIRQIIEELTEDYDLPDVEIRKVLIEELTKEQLMEEEEAMRLRLVEERQQRIIDEEERLRKEEEELARQAAEEKQSEEERIRAEKEAEKQKRRIAKAKRMLEDDRIRTIYKKELEWFYSHMKERLELRGNEEEARIARERELQAKENALLSRYQKELGLFTEALPQNIEIRAAKDAARREEEEALLKAKLERIEQQQKPRSWFDRWRKGRD